MPTNGRTTTTGELTRILERMGSAEIAIADVAYMSAPHVAPRQFNAAMKLLRHVKAFHRSLARQVNTKREADRGSRG